MCFLKLDSGTRMRFFPVAPPLCTNMNRNKTMKPSRPFAKTASQRNTCTVSSTYVIRVTLYHVIRGMSIHIIVFGPRGGRGDASAGSNINIPLTDHDSGAALDERVLIFISGMHRMNLKGYIGVKDFAQSAETGVCWHRNKAGSMDAAAAHRRHSRKQRGCLP